MALSVSHREHYRVHSEVWYEAMVSKDAVFDRCEQVLRGGMDVVGRSSPADARIAKTLSFFEFMQRELPAMLKRWREPRPPRTRQP